MNLNWTSLSFILINRLGSITINKINNPKVLLYDTNLEIDLLLDYAKDLKAKGSNPVLFDEVLDLNGKGDFQEKLKVKEGTYTTLKKLTIKKFTNRVNQELEIQIFNKEEKVSSEKIEFVGMPGVVTLLPALFLISTCLFSKQALIPLTIGLFIMSTFVNGFRPDLGVLRMLDTYITNSFVKDERNCVILFTFFLSGLIVLITKSGGAEGLANFVSKYAKTRQGGQLAAYILGLFIFFDDYASVLIVGSNLQPLTDLLFISREKLAFIVHVTSSAPVSISPISSWIGFELGLISDVKEKYFPTKSAFTVFLNTIVSRFFPILMLILIAVLIFTKKDFGPMLEAERRALFDKKVSEDEIEEVIFDPIKPDEKTPKRLLNAMIPVISVIVITLISLFVTGYYAIIKKGGDDFGVLSLLENANSLPCLVYASFISSFIAWVLYKFQNILTFTESINAYIIGIKDIMESTLILIIAWSISDVTGELRTGEFIVNSLGDSLSYQIIPTLIFLISALFSFSTGTSFGTMTLMFPLTLPLAHKVNPDETFLTFAVSAILTGSIFGDITSPISETSILVSASSKCGVKRHIVTQLPYGILVSITSVLACYIPVGYGWYPNWAALLISTVLLVLFVYFVGTTVNSQDDDFTARAFNFYKQIPLKSRKNVKSSKEIV